ncbi:hypothetical protein M758_UG117600 [Ceratodon purpureus]|nr:hypothetical protein M758_UG117600 [Ceratodon purpureus]
MSRRCGSAFLAPSSVSDDGTEPSPIRAIQAMSRRRESAFFAPSSDSDDETKPMLFTHLPLLPRLENMFSTPGAASFMTSHAWGVAYVSNGKTEAVPEGARGSSSQRYRYAADDEHEQWLSGFCMQVVEQNFDIIDPLWDLPDLEQDWSPCPFRRAIFGPLDTEYAKCKSYLLKTLLFFKVAELYGCEIETFGRVWRMVYSWLLETGVLSI